LMDYNTSVPYELSALPGPVTLEVYNTNAACTPVGAPIRTQVFNPSDNKDILVPKSDVVIRIITPCGTQRDFCLRYTAPDPFAIEYEINQIFCASTANPNGTINLYLNSISGGTWPYNYVLKNSSGVIIANNGTDPSFPNL